MKYRDNVCAVIRKKTDNSVLLCHRRGFLDNAGWQFPQGGINQQSDLIEELKRELREEIGTDHIAVIFISTKTYTYDYPNGSLIQDGTLYIGQKQRWVLVDLLDEHLHQVNSLEFDDFQWVTPQEALEMVVQFKKNVYNEALHDLGLL